MSEQGIIKWYSLARGYGFIRREGSGDDDDDVFVHHSEAPDDPLAEGERVTFELIDGPKGLQARNVRRTTAARAESPEADPTVPPE